MKHKKSTGSRKKKRNTGGRPSSRKSSKTGKSKRPQKVGMPKGLDGLKSPNNPHVSFYWDKPDYKEEEREGLYESSLSGVHRIRADSNRKMKSE